MKFNSMDDSCLTCMNKCKNKYVGTNICSNRIEAPTEFKLEELNKEIRLQNVNLKRLCSKGYKIGNKIYKLNYKLLRKMIEGKSEFEYKYWTILNSRLEEDSWVVDFLRSNPTGFCETNRFDEGIFI